MDFRILGPLEVVERGRTFELGGQKQRVLLAMLLLHVNEVVSTDRLIDALWEDRPPARAQKALQVYVSQLRKLLGRERLETKAPGYLLRVAGDELDLARFQRLAEEGKTREALALWRGPPLSDVAYSRFAQAEIARLEELRLAALEEHVERELAAGRDTQLVGELEALVREHPLRERLRGQLMLALYRSGRQAEALEAYQDARRALTDELGIEPGRELRELQQAILQQDPELEIAAGKATVEEVPPPRVPSTLELSTREVRKTVTAVTADLSTSVERLDAETLRRLTSRCFEETTAIFERHGGSVEQSIGGTVTAVFGIPVIHEDDALRALRSAAEVRQCVDELGPELEATWGARLLLRVGVSTGEVLTGGEPHALGGPVSAAAALQQAAGPDQILLDEATLRLARDAVDVERQDGRLALVSVLPSIGHPIRLRSAMVGRERERRRLHDAFEQAVSDSSCQLFTILGLAGVGKSRLVEEFLGDVVDSARVTRGRCLPYGEGITFWPVVEAVRELARLDDTDSPEAAVAKLVDVLQDEQDAEQVALRVAEVIGLAETALGAEEGFAAVRALLETLAGVQPLVIVFDDIHWGEPTFLDLVEYLADWTRDVPVLLTCLARPELLDVRPGWGGGKVNATSTLLEPLSEAESVQLVQNLAGRELDEPARRRIIEAAEGNPLFVEEMLALALEERDRPADIVVPPTIQALLAARLDRLSDDDRAVIERAAVQGKVFYDRALAELSPEELRPAIPQCLRSLLHKELVRPERASFGGRTYRFRHLLIRDAAYDAIPKEARSDLHERFARWLETVAGERAAEYEEIVGYHLEQAYRYRAELGPVDAAAGGVAREAAERLGAAGRRAFVRSDAPAGVNLISRAAQLLPPDDPLRIELIPNVRVVQGVSDDLAWAERVLTEGVEAAATTGDRGLAAHALVQRGLLRLFTAADVTAAELLDTAQRAIAVFEELPDELGLARAWRLVAQAHYLSRRAGPSAEAAERALAHARRAGDRFEQREIEEWLLIALVWGPLPAADAAARCRRLLDESAGDRVREILALAALAHTLTMCNRLDESRDVSSRARRMLGELGEGIWIASFHLAEMSLRLGDAVAAERDLRPQYEMLKRIDEKSHFSPMAQLLADAAYRQGRYEEAEQLTVECEEASRANDVHDQIRWRATRAKVLARAGAFAEAEALAREATAMGAGSDFLVAHAEALIDLAEVLELIGKKEQAGGAVEKAIESYELKGNLQGSEQARLRLAELRG